MILNVAYYFLHVFGSFFSSSRPPLFIEHDPTRHLALFFFLVFFYLPHSTRPPPCLVVFPPVSPPPNPETPPMRCKTQKIPPTLSPNFTRGPFFLPPNNFQRDVQLLTKTPIHTPNATLTPTRANSRSHHPRPFSQRYPRHPCYPSCQVKTKKLSFSPADTTHNYPTPL